MFDHIMAFLESTMHGGSPLMYEGGFDLSLRVTQRNMLDAFNIVLVVIFYLLLLLCYVRNKNQNTGRSTRKSDYISVAVAFCCFLTSLAYLVTGLWEATDITHQFNFKEWWVVIVRALIWASLMVSLLIERFGSVKFLASVWWIVFFGLNSFLNVKNLVEKCTVVNLVYIEWANSFLLLLCALRNLKHFCTKHTQNHTLSEPLLVNETLNGNARHLQEPSFISKLTFSWVNPLLALGYKKTLVLQDIPSVASVDQASIAHKKFTNEWNLLINASTNNSNLVPKVLAKVYFWEMVISGVLVFLRTIAVVASPVLLYAFVKYTNSDTKDLHQGLVLVGCLIVVKVVESLSHRQFFFSAKRTGMRMRSALMVAVYEKQLKLSSLGRKRHSTGEIVNYIAVDSYRMGEFPMWFHVGWSSFLQLFLAIGVLFFIVGLGVLPGLVPLCICGMLNFPFGKAIQKCQLEFMIAQDKRLRSTSEILNNMKVIKLQSWEEKFQRIVESCRETEFHWLHEVQFKKVYSTILYWTSPTLVSSAILFGCVFLSSAPLDAATIFTILATLRTMSEPVRFFPDALSALIQVKVSLDRINSILVDDELQDNSIKDQELEKSHGSISIQNGNFAWDPESPTPTLKNVNLEVKYGHKVAVCGSVGAGKSSLLYAILGEISKTSGTVGISGTIAYVSQTSWIQSGTIQDNILYGKPMERTKYEKAIMACALDKDIETFNYGDLTEIGQRGLNLSGGQKQRIQLARAVYSDADIYLLDDPFSAVDVHTAATLFNDCVMTCLKGKTVILVTHQVEFLPLVDDILVIKDGQIIQSGSYEDLLMAGAAFEQLVNAHKDAITGLEPSSHENPSRLHKQVNMHQSVKDKNISSISKEDNVKISGVQLTEEEEKEIGNVGWKSFLDYVMVSQGTWHFSLTLLATFGFVGLQAAASYWLAFGIQIPEITTTLLISVYTLAAATSIFFVYLRSVSVTLLGLKASKSFFNKFTASIFSAPMLFFDSTPVGRILTRASSDLNVIDFDIPFSFAFVVAGSVEVLGTIGVMASVTWQVLIVVVLATVATKYAQGYYQPTARELMRINGTTKAPVMNYTSETSLGVATIRAFKMQDRFFKNYLKLVDTDASTFIFSNATLEWLILRTEAFSNLILFTAGFLLVLIPKGFVSPGMVGLSLSYALVLTTAQVFFIRWYCSLANYIVSVERVKQFMHLQTEPPSIVENNRPPSSWPSKGRIEFEELKLRYRPNAPLVLKGITCTFKEGTRVGIVGRTGSGKTTLITALFRLVEPDSGRIFIDGIDICHIGLKDLRMKLSVIPQEPTLFRGSIRTNMDPLGIYSDDDIWKALEKCQLKSTIASLPKLLNSSVSDEGDNWSAGQRQLFCLGRVLLRKNKILVLDEATASIDSTTDATLQRIIREEFSSCTVITVAHRVPTVIDSDKVMVLSYGEMVEYDETSKLMETDSFFSKLVAEYWSSCERKSVQ
uniref:ABC transporter C family member 8-like n=1 Tax=Erigeron canadensis TaxID=72917 RepID=UPI001CB8AB96|nr:ABC transporter C family member 8-like [Erigeron canadensis]